MISLDWFELVAKDETCVGKGNETSQSINNTSNYSPTTSRVQTIKDCANYCYGNATMFSFSANLMKDSDGCNQTHSNCRCEKSVNTDDKCTQIEENGTDLYQLQKRKKGMYVLSLSNLHI